MQRLLGVAAGLLLAAGVAAAMTHTRPEPAHPAPSAIDESPALSPTSAEPSLVLRPGQTKVTGTVTMATLTGAQAPPLTTPLIITVPNRGSGGLRLSGALMNGRRATIEWNAGQPLPLNGRGGLDQSPATLDVSAAGIRWHLDGAPRSLVPGRYSFGAPVAVGSSGLATPQDSAEFLADATTAFTTSGDAGVTIASRPIEVTGPGTLELRGDLEERTPSGTNRVSTARFVEGPYDVVLTPEGSGWRVDALVQGARQG